VRLSNLGVGWVPTLHCMNDRSENDADPRRGEGALGRPRDSTLHKRVLREARIEIAAVGVDAFNLRAVLRRAKVGNSGFYRRWSGAEELVLETLASLATWPSVPDRGNLRAELEQLTEAFDHPETWTTIQMLFTFAGQADSHPELFAHYQQEIILPGNRHVVEVFERARARGEYHPATTPNALAAGFIGALLIGKQWSMIGIGELKADFGAVVDTFVALSNQNGGLDADS
jgi:AcrR family transcriptional regulator